MYAMNEWTNRLTFSLEIVDFDAIKYRNTSNSSPLQLYELPHVASCDRHR